MSVQHLSTINKAIEQAYAEGDEAKVVELLKTKQAIEQDIAAQEVPAEVGLAEAALDIPISGARGLVTGLAETAALPSAAEQLAGFGVRKLEERLPGVTEVPRRIAEALPESLKRVPSVGAISGVFTGERVFPGLDTIMSLIERVPGAKALTQYQPKTVPGRLVESTAEFAAPGLPFVRTGRAAAKTLGVGAAGGVPYELLEEEAPMAGLGAALTGQLLAARALKPKQADRIIRDVARTIDDKEFEVAKLIEEEAVRLNIPISAAEIVDNKLLQRLGEDVYKSTSGGPGMYEYFKSRPDIIKSETEKLVGTIMKNPEYRKAAFQEVKEAGIEAVKQAKLTRTFKSDEIFELADQQSIDPNLVTSIIKKIDDRINRLDADDTANKTMLLNIKRGLTKKVEKPKEITLPDGQKIKTKPKIIPEVNIEKISNLARRYREKHDDSTTGILKDKEALNSLGRNILFNQNQTGIADDLFSALKTNKDYKEASDLYQKLSEELVEVVRDSVGGLYKGKASPAAMQKFVFDPDLMTDASVKSVYTELNKVNKEAFPKLVGLYIQNASRKAFKKTPQGKSLKTGFNLYNILAGDAQKAEIFNRALLGVADAKGLNKTQTANYVEGFKKFGQILERTARLANIDRPTGVLPDFQKGITKQAAQIGSFMWRLKLATRYGEFVEDKTFKELTKILTSDNSVQELQRIGRLAVGSEEAAMRAANIITALDMPALTAERLQPEKEE